MGPKGVIVKDPYIQFSLKTYETKGGLHLTNINGIGEQKLL